MTSQKFIAFIEKLLERTKSGQIQWQRCRQPLNWASAKKSFSCIAGTMEVHVYADEDLEDITFTIDYDNSMPSASLDVESDDVMRVAKRLVNYLYDLFPNLEKSIDQFLTDF